MVLDAILDTPAAGPLRLSLDRMITEHAPVHVDGQAVDRIGLACLQVLVAARTAAKGLSLGFQITTPSPALIEMATLAGLATLVTV